MHLGLIPFVPHNLISAQDSPVPLPNFQMAPRFKTSMSSVSKEGTQIYYRVLSKSPGKRIPSRFPQRGPYGEGYPHTGHFYVSLDIVLLTYLAGSPVKKPSFQVPLMESPQREIPRS